ncbi:MAG: VWA-like domain-containing protein [Bacteroidota bacterium]
MSKQKDPLEKLAKTSIQIMLNEPFYGHFFASLVKQINPKVESLGTTIGDMGQLELVLNPNYWEDELAQGQPFKPGIEISQLHYGAIKHQILHLLFKHMLQYHQYPNKRLFGIAADLVVNQYIDRAQLEKDAITFDTFPELKLKSGQSLEYYYQQLKDLQEGKFEEETGYQAPSDFGPEEDSEVEEAPILVAEENLNRLLIEHDRHLAQHELWWTISQKGKGNMRIIESMIDHSILAHYSRTHGGKQRGNLPQGITEWIKKILDSKKASVNWKRVLRLFAASSSRTYIKQTIKRSSKRYGTVPGIKVKRKQKLLVAIDTSASVQTEDLQRFFQEVHHIWKQGVEIMVVECDVIIQNQYLYKGAAPEEVSGRGGTAFDAPIHFANSNYHPDAIVYFTDGFAPPPQEQSRKPILWLITQNGISQNDSSWKHLPGRIVKMN